MTETIELPKLGEAFETLPYKPTISIFLPFNPKMVPKSEITACLKDAAKKVEGHLLNGYSAEIVFLMMQKLKSIFEHLNFSTHNKSVAIYLSPIFEKIIYLDIAVQEKVLVDDSFSIRDLVYSKQPSNEYLLLTITGKEANIYIGDTGRFVRILSGRNDFPTQPIDNIADEPKQDVVLENFLRQVDRSLALILHAYRLPLFLMGSKKILNQFHSFTKHKSSIIDCIYGNIERAQLEDLNQFIYPYIKDWRKVKQRALTQYMEDAAANHRLVTGICDVWTESAHNSGLLLIVEKTFEAGSWNGRYHDSSFLSDRRFAKYSYIKDAVDEIIEKVLENGGDVEFVDEGVLDDYQQIALIKHS